MQHWDGCVLPPLALTGDLVLAERAGWSGCDYAGRKHRVALDTAAHSRSIVLRKHLLWFELPAFPVPHEGGRSLRSVDGEWPHRLAKLNQALTRLRGADQFQKLLAQGDIGASDV